MMKNTLLLVAAGLFSAGNSPILAAGAEDLVRALKPTVVNIHVTSPVAIDGDVAGSWLGTGFIADAKEGLVVTNRHVSGRSPAQYKITFLNGESTHEVKLAYYDAWRDFAILKFDPSSVKFPLKAVEFGDSRAVKEQDKVLLIGNNEGQNYTVLHGEVTSTAINDGVSGNLNRHGGCFRVIFGNRGGSSGSPVFDAKGKVVGLHFAGSDASGMELRIEYVLDGLRCLAAQSANCRGDAGVQLDLMKTSDAQKHLHLPQSLIQGVLSSPEFKDSRDIVYVAKSVPGGAAVGRLEPGDVVVKVDGAPVGDSLYQFDKVVDGKVGGQVTVDVVRNGSPLSVPVGVQDANAQKITSFVTFAGGVFQDISPELRRKYNITTPGVFLNQAEPGSSMAIGISDTDKHRLVVVEAVNGKPTSNLSAFTNEIKQLKENENIYLTMRDFMGYDSAPKAVLVTLGDLQYYPLKKFNFSQQDLKWGEEPVTKPLN